MTTEIFPLNIGEGKMLNISIADKPIIVNGYVHLQAGEYQSLAYKLRDDQAESFREWLDRNTGLIDLNEGDRVALSSILSRIECCEFELQDDYEDALNEIGAIAAKRLGVTFVGIGGVENED